MAWTPEQDNKVNDEWFKHITLERAHRLVTEHPELAEALVEQRPAAAELLEKSNTESYANLQRKIAMAKNLRKKGVQEDDASAKYARTAKKQRFYDADTVSKVRDILNSKKDK